MLTAELPTSRRERKKTATRDAIHEAALGLAEEVGLCGVTVEAIAERADVAPRTFFNHFPSKVHAIVGRDAERAARVQAAIEQRPAGEAPLDALRHVLLDDFLPDDEAAAQLLRQLAVVRPEPALRAAMHADFEETERAMVAAVAARTGRSAATDPYPALVVSAAVAAMRVSLLRWAEQRGREPLEPAVTHAFSLLADGLTTSATESTPS